jgi:copper chaperone
MNDATTYRVSEVGSGHCSAAIVEEVGRLKGVQRVDVDLPPRLVRVSGRGVEVPAVIAAIYAAGYEAVSA